MERAVVTLGKFCFKLCFGLLWALGALGQQTLDAPQVPPNFNLDLETAARLRPQFMAQSMAATGRYAAGRLALERLVNQLDRPLSKFKWELRMVDDGELNAYSSPDGTIYVETGLAKLADQSAGLWAAVLSHEIAHVVHRDWARRYLYQKSLESGGGAVITLGDPGLPSASWTDTQRASAKLGRFCRQLEIDADREGLMLMARAGYHPDFVPALHHLLHADNAGAAAASIYAMHPCWEQRDKELLQAYADASIEFEHRWPEWYASPGGNPPVLVFAEAPTVRKSAAKEWEVQLPMRCENLAGAVEVVLRYGPVAKKAARRKDVSNSLHSELEVRQLTGCTSPRTMVSFTLADSSERHQPDSYWADVYVLDAWGGVLARADVARLPR